MRFVFHNPHGLIWYKLHYYYFANDLKCTPKCEYLFDYFYIDKKSKIYVYLDNGGWDVSPFVGRFENFSSPLINFYIWVLINRLNPFRFKVITDINELKEDDVLMTFLYEHFTSFSGSFKIPRESLIKGFKRTKALKVVHLSHYGFYSSLGSKNTFDAETDLFISENNLTRNSKFFQHYYSWYKKDVYALPFVPQSRFIRTKKFKERKNKAVATGTITFPMADSDFLSFFGNNQLHPMRLEIFNNSDRIKDCIDSLIYKYKIPDLSDQAVIAQQNIVSCKSNNLINNLKTLKIVKLIKRIVLKIFPELSLFKKQAFIIAKIISAFFRKKTIQNISNEMDYYKSDIVKTYNEYKMFIVPEEIIDLPGIGFVEGMFCGSAFIGKKNQMYADIGLIDNVNYISYDGTLCDLIDKIKYYQNHEEELNAIAEAGYKFATTSFTRQKVTEKLLSKLECELKSKRSILNDDG